MIQAPSIALSELVTFVKFYRKDVCVCVLVVQSCATLWTPWTVAHQAPLLWNSPDKNTGVGCHFLLQGIFLTQRSNLDHQHCRQILYI